MKKTGRKRGIIVIVIAVITLTIIISIQLKKNHVPAKDVVTYDGKTYVCLEYNMDIFTYNFRCDEFYEEDEIHPVEHEKWDAVYFEGDIFILDEQVEEAESYYSDDSNYDWYVVFDVDDSEVMVPLEIERDEAEFIYDLENVEERETMTFDEIEQFASVTKVSKDESVYALVSLAKCRDSWYWKTEIMNDADEEYIVELPESLVEKIFDVETN